MNPHLQSFTMSKLVLLLLCVLLLHPQLSDCRKSRTGGGVNAKDDEAPYLASLEVNGIHECSGSIIRPEWVLTAAHCIGGQEVPNLNVVVGANTLNVGGDSYTVQQLIVNPAYTLLSPNNDIGLVQLQGPITFRAGVGQIELATEEIPVGAQVSFSGWNFISQSRSTPNNLQTQKSSVVSNKKCFLNFIALLLTNKNICLSTKTGEDACKGDPGAPLVYEGKQVGIVPFNRPCLPGKCSVYIKVFAYLDWILAHVK